jgi:serine/threonine protein kinase
MQDSYGKVYQADVLGGVHAIRVLDGTLFTPAKFSSFLEMVASLRNPHVVAIKGAAPERGILVQELPESGNVLYLIQTGSMPSGQPMQWNDSVDIGLAVASALQYLHCRPQPVPHGALNSSSVLVDRNGIAKLSDIGLAELCSNKPLSKDELMMKDIRCLGMPSPPVHL